MNSFPVILLAVFLASAIPLQAQYTDTTGAPLLQRQPSPVIINWQAPPLSQPFPYRGLLIPATLIAYGVITIENDELKYINKEIKEDLWDERPHARSKIDNYLQWAPAVAVYGLNAAGIHGKHNFKDRTLIYGISTLIMGTTVFTLKRTSGIQRPDTSDYSSFPSGHTATAFAAAEFMWQEYKNVSPWYGVAGYAVAATTGYMRMYNNKHWLGDVVAGAGIGIASTKLAYWVYPKIQKILFHRSSTNTVVLPGYQQGAFTIGLIHQF